MIEQSGDPVLGTSPAGAGRADGDRPTILWRHRDGTVTITTEGVEWAAPDEQTACAALVADGIDGRNRLVLHRIGFQTAERAPDGEWLTVADIAEGRIPPDRERPKAGEWTCSGGQKGE